MRAGLPSLRSQIRSPKIGWRVGPLALVLAVLSCTPVGTNLIGPLREVTVVSSEWELVEPTVRSILQQPILTPQPEPEFKVRVGSPDRFDTFSKFRIILLIGTSADTLIRQVLGARADSLSEGDFGLLKVPNPWLQGQTGLIFVGRDSSKLAPGLQAYAGRLRQTLRGAVLDQLGRAAYVEGVERALTDSLSQRYAFSIDVPRRWLVNEDAARAGFIYLFGHVPDRNVFAFWQDSTRALVSESMAVLRDRLTGTFYDGDSIDRQFLAAETISFLAGPCLRLSGVWKNEREVIGGPFVNYSLNFRGRFYMLDGLVYDPGKKKLNALTQVEAVMRTFVPK